MTKLILLLSLALVACQETKPVSTSGTNNPDAQVDTLFTKDGCTVYRFYDRMYSRYFVKCTYGCGKSCTANDNIQTEYN